MGLWSRIKGIFGSTAGADRTDGTVDTNAATFDTDGAGTTGAGTSGFGDDDGTSAGNAGVGGAGGAKRAGLAGVAGAANISGSVSSVSSPPLPLLRDAALEAAIAAAPDDPAPYLVYADWLQERGDPRGELIALAHARLITTSPEEDRTLALRQRALEAAHDEHLHGPLTASRISGESYLGFVRALVIDERVALEQVEELLASDHPSLAFVRAIDSADRHDELHALIGDRPIAIRDEPEVWRITATATHDETGFWVGLGEQVTDDTGSYSYAVRTTLGAESWWHGSCDAVTEEQIYDDPAHSGSLVIPPLAHPTALLVELRFRIPSSDATPSTQRWYSGRTRVPTGRQPFEFFLIPCGPLTGPPFELSPIEAVTPAAGPELFPGTGNPTGAAIPGVGLYH